MLEIARIKDPDLAAALELSRLMGLRSQEAVQSAQSLKTWKQAVERGPSHCRPGRISGDQAGGLSAIALTNELHIFTHDSQESLYRATILGLSADQHQIS